MIFGSVRLPAACVRLDILSPDQTLRFHSGSKPCDCGRGFHVEILEVLEW